MALIVTRGGWGDVWEVEDPDTHPLFQYGDAIVRGPADIESQYNILEIGRLVEKLGVERTLGDVRHALRSTEGQPHHLRADRLREHMPAVWDALCLASRSAPQDASETLNLIREDRQKYDREYQKMNTTASNTADNKAANDTSKAAASGTKKEAKAPAAPKPPKYADSDKIVMGTDKDGKKFSRDNNPKRAGTKSAERFSKLVDGMSVGAFVKALGGNDEARRAAFADIDYGIEKKQLSVQKTQAAA